MHRSVSGLGEQIDDGELEWKAGLGHRAGRRDTGPPGAWAVMGRFPRAAWPLSRRGREPRAA